MNNAGLPSADPGKDHALASHDDPVAASAAVPAPEPSSTRFLPKT
jgi:hypothetical protein